MADDEHDDSLVNSIIFAGAAVFNQHIAEMNVAFITSLIEDEAPEQWVDDEPR